MYSCQGSLTKNHLYQNRGDIGISSRYYCTLCIYRLNIGTVKGLSPSDVYHEKIDALLPYYSAKYYKRHRLPLCCGIIGRVRGAITHACCKYDRPALRMYSAYACSTCFPAPTVGPIRTRFAVVHFVPACQLHCCFKKLV